MPECAFHPGTETNVRCVECDRYICPKDFITTPVGYKCKECGRPAASARRLVKPRQLAIAIAASLGVGIAGAFLLRFLGVYFWLIAVLLGVATGEAARRGSGGHRTGAIAVVAAVSVALGCFVAGLGYTFMILSAAAAAIYVGSGGR